MTVFNFPLQDDVIPQYARVPYPALMYSSIKKGFDEGARRALSSLARANILPEPEIFKLHAELQVDPYNLMFHPRIKELEQAFYSKDPKTVITQGKLDAYYALWSAGLITQEAVERIGGFSPLLVDKTYRTHYEKLAESVIG